MHPGQYWIFKPHFKLSYTHTVQSHFSRKISGTKTSGLYVTETMIERLPTRWCRSADVRLHVASNCSKTSIKTCLSRNSFQFFQSILFRRVINNFGNGRRLSAKHPTLLKEIPHACPPGRKLAKIIGDGRGRWMRSTQNYISIRAYVFELLTQLIFNQNVLYTLFHCTHIFWNYISNPFEFPGRPCETVPRIVRSFNLWISCGQRAKMPPPSPPSPHSH